MKKLVEFIMPIKFFAAMAFFGLIALYVAGGILYVIVTGNAIEYAVPFVYVLQSAVLSLVIAALWALFFNETVSKRWRFFLRYTLFSLILFALLTVCFFTFLAIPSEWVKLVLAAAVVVFIGTTIFLTINELHYRKTGERYMEILNVYKRDVLR